VKGKNKWDNPPTQKGKTIMAKPKKAEKKAGKAGKMPMKGKMAGKKSCK
jgi:hypothetical protein